MTSPIVDPRPPLGLARSIIVPVVVGVAAVLPFVTLEWMNSRGFQQGAPVALFVLMWLLVAVFTAAAMPIVRRTSTGQGGLVLDIGFVSRVVFLVSVAWVWVALVSDQMPCFLGVPNCD